jgi:hypothetical protein
MSIDHKITHSIICEHTRQLAAHDKAKPDIKGEKQPQKASSESRLKEVNRSRRMLLANALRLRRMVKALPDGSN